MRRIGPILHKLETVPRQLSVIFAALLQLFELILCDHHVVLSLVVAGRLLPIHLCFSMTSCSKCKCFKFAPAELLLSIVVIGVGVAWVGGIVT